jgi:ABC-type antimicrobial peptide transport system permease subunit
MNRKTQRIFLFTLLICLAFTLPGCRQNTEAIARRDAYVSFLEEAKGDFADVHAMVNDKDLELEDDTTASEDTMTADQYKALLKKTTDYKTKIDNKVSAIEKRSVAKDPQLSAFTDSELYCLKLASDVLTEYEQIIQYVISVTDIGEQMGAIGALDFSDMQNIEATYKTFSEAIKSIVDGLKNSNPPSFLKYVNDEMVGIYQEMDDATVYVLNAAIINDPLKLDAGTYRFGLLQNRRLPKMLSEFQASIKNRQAKLKEDITRIKTLDSGLTDWIEANLKALGASKGEE